MADKSRWPDFSEYDMRLIIVTLRNGSQRIGMVNGSRFPERLKKLGFKASRAAKGLYLTSRFTDENGRIRGFSVAEFRRSFPEARVAEMTAAEIYGEVAPAKPARSSSQPKPQRQQATRDTQATRRAVSKTNSTTKSTSQATRQPVSKPAGTVSSSRIKGWMSPLTRQITDRLKSEVPGFVAPGTVNLIFEYEPGGEGILPMRLTFTKEGALRRVQVRAAYPENGAWYLDSEFTLGLDGQSLEHAWFVNEGEKTPAQARNHWSQAVQNILHNGTLTTREIPDWFDEIKQQFETVKALTDMDASFFVGRNEKGEEVYEAPEGRFVSGGPNKDPEIESPHGADARFLRAATASNPDWDALISCARAARKYRDNTKTLSHDEVDAFAATVFGPRWTIDDTIDNTDDDQNSRDEAVSQASSDIRSRLDWASNPDAQSAHDVSVMALEAVLALNIADDFAENAGNLERVFDDSRASLPQQTPAGAAALPLPMAAAMRRALGHRFSHLVDCNAQSPIFIGMLPRSSLATLLVPDDQIEAFGDWFEKSAGHVPVRKSVNATSLGAPAGSDRMIGSFTDGRSSQAMKPFIMDNQLRLMRRDHQEVANLMPALADDGTAVFMIDADGESINGEPAAQAGEISQNSHYFLNWLHDHYNVALVADVSADMFALDQSIRDTRDTRDTQGNNPRRLIVVSGRKPAPTVTPVPEKLDVIRNYSDLWNAATAAGINADEVAQQALDADESSANDSEDIEVGTTDVTEVKREDLQLPYVPHSRLSTSSTMVPKNLAAPTNRAFERLYDKALKATGFPDGTRKDVDDWVCEMMGMDRPTLAQCLGADQVDAVALNAYARQRGRGFILGDQTGVGKGRVLIATARIAAQRGVSTVMLTERRDLFSNLWEDVHDMQSESVLKPFVINNGGVIEDANGDVVDAGSSARTAEVMEHLKDPNNTAMPVNEQGEKANFFLMTYSQVATSKERTEMLERLLASGAELILDESHNGAGADSNISKALNKVMDWAQHVTYSSATFGKTDYNLDLYRRVLPESVDPMHLKQVIRSGGEPMQEVFANMLAEDGVLIRREHDLGSLNLCTVVDEAREQQNKDMADAFAGVMSSIAQLGEKSSRLNQAMTGALRQSAKATGMNLRLPGGVAFSVNLQTANPNFGSRFHNLTRQFILGIKAEYAAERAVQHAKEGRKPVILLENTMETLLKRFLESEVEKRVTAAGLEIDSKEGDEMAKRLHREGLVLDHMPQYRDLLRNVIDDAYTIKFRNKKLKKTFKMDLRGLKHVMDANTKAALKIVDNATDALLKDIDRFPDLPMSPIDTTLNILKANGVNCGELTARSYAITPVEGGHWHIGPNVRQDRLKTIDKFNNGSLDAVLMNRSASSGSNLHSNVTFADRRQRVLIELQVLNNVVDRVQAFGRINRRGQVVEPMIEVASSGVPAEQRVLAMQNIKMRKLNATTTSNREGAFLADTIDILNKVGDEACRRYLEMNPDVANQLSLDVLPMEDETIVDRMGNSSLSSLSNLVTARMIMLNVDNQESIYKALHAEYKALVRELDSKGQNPLRTRELPGTCEIKQQDVIHGVKTADGQYKTAFDRPVTMTQLHYEVPFTILRSKEILSRMQRSQAKLNALSHHFGVRVGANIQSLVANRFEDKMMSRINLLSKRPYRTFAEAEQAEPDNKTMLGQIEHARRTSNFLRSTSPGTVIQFTHEMSKMDGVICDYSIDVNLISNPALQGIGIAVPGRGLCQCSIERLLFDPNFAVKGQFSADHVLSQAFDEAKSDSYPMRSIVLDGNPFMASMVSHSRNLKSEPVIYTDDSGQTSRGQMIKDLQNPGKVLSGAMMPCAHFNLVEPFLVEHPTQRLATSSEREPSKDVFVSFDAKKNVFLLRIPASKYGKRFREDPELMNTMTAYNRKTRQSFEGEIPAANMSEAMARVYVHRARFNIRASHNNWVQDKIAKVGAQDAASYLRQLNQQRSNADVNAVATQVSQTNGQANGQQNQPSPYTAAAGATP